VNTYTIDNVRIRYSASNAKGYAQGLDFRLNGEFVPEQNLGLVLAILKQRKIAKIKAI
jgi:predicted transcriptional regulator with HTH domain